MGNALTTQHAMETLQDVETWLTPWKTSLPTEPQIISASMFSAAYVEKMFSIVFATSQKTSQTMTMTVTSVAINTQSCTLSGTVASIMDVENIPVVMTFSQSQDGRLTCSLAADAGDISWKPFSACSYDMEFNDVNASFMPVSLAIASSITPLTSRTPVINMAFSAQISFSKNSSDAINLPKATITIPSAKGDWLLKADLKKDPLSLSSNQLKKMMSGHDVVGTLLAGYFDIKDISLNAFEVGFHPKETTCTFLRIGLGIKKTKPWSIFDGKFTLTDVNFLVTLLTPFPTPPSSLQAVAKASMTIASKPFDIEVLFDHDIAAAINSVAFYASLSNISLDIKEVFESFHITAPMNLLPSKKVHHHKPTISCINFCVYPSLNSFDIGLSIDNPIPIIGDVTLESMGFELSATYEQKKLTVSGDIHTNLQIGETSLLLSGEYSSSGSWGALAKVGGLDLGTILTDIATKFGAHVSDIPSIIQNMELQMLEASFSKGGSTENFSFILHGTTTMSGVDIMFAPNFQLTYNSATKVFKPTFTGDLILSDGTNQYHFTIDVTSNSGTSKINATYTGTALSIDTLSNIFGVSVADIPSEIDLSINTVTFAYETDSNHPDNDAIVFSFASSSYDSKGVLIRLPINNTKETFAVLDIDRHFSLSDLPVIGSDIPPEANATVTNLALLYASLHPLESSQIDTINSKITALDSTAVLLPKPQNNGTVSSEIALSVTLKAANLSSHLFFDFESHTDRTDEELTQIAATSTMPPPIKWTSIEKTIGPISFEKIGFLHKQSAIWVYPDVTLSKSGLSLTLDGLALSIPLSDLSTKTFTPSFHLDGLGVSYENAAVEVSGGFIGDIDPVNFSGEVSIRAANFSFSALAEYQNITNAGHTHPSFFVFLILDENIGGPPYCFITGVAGGFGYNQALSIPSPAKLNSFPLIQSVQAFQSASPASSPLSPSMSPTSALSVMQQGNDLTPQYGEDWLAAGITFSSFETINSFAMVMVSFGTDFNVNIIGTSTASLPASSTSPVTFAQLDLKASFTPSRGLLAIGGRLTNSSYVLSPDCHLTGGFAFYLWFGGAHKGDFVITLGGYSPHATLPSYYPAEPRLGINWQINSDLSIKGDEYFALTPSQIMAGGALEAAWHSGPVSAWFDLHADFDIGWKPFHYHAGISVQLGAAVTLHAVLFTVHITIHVGAELEIWGPDFSGQATIDLSIISFTVSFGDASRAVIPLKFSDFITQFFPADKNSGDHSVSEVKGVETANADRTICHIHPTAGLVTSGNSTIDWVVDPETFAVKVYSLIPSTDYTLNGTNLTLSASSQTPVTTSFDIKPCYITAVTSKLTITVTNSKSDSTFAATAILENIPKALWHYTDDNDDTSADMLLPETLTGFHLIPYVPAPDTTVPILMHNLKYTLEATENFAWNTPYVPSSNKFSNSTVPSTINEAPATDNRPLIIAALQQYAPSIDGTVNITNLASAATYYLAAPLLYRLLGEQV